MQLWNRQTLVRAVTLRLGSKVRGSKIACPPDSPRVLETWWVEMFLELEKSAEERELAKEKQLEVEFGQLLEVNLSCFFVVCNRSQLKGILRSWKDIWFPSFAVTTSLQQHLHCLACSFHANTLKLEVC